MFARATGGGRRPFARRDETGWATNLSTRGTSLWSPPPRSAVLKEFENAFDGTVKGAGASTPANEALATAGIVLHALHAIRAGALKVVTRVEW